MNEYEAHTEGTRPWRRLDESMHEDSEQRGRQYRPRTEQSGVRRRGAVRRDHETRVERPERQPPGQ